MWIVRLRQLSVFYRELATMIQSNMDILGAMDVLTDYSGTVWLKEAARQVKFYLSQGDSLSDALSRFPDIFSQWQVNIVNYSETGGRLAEGLGRIADFLEKDYNMQKSLIAGLAYPAILLHCAMFLFPLPQLVQGNAAGYAGGVLKVALPVYLLIGFIVSAGRLSGMAGIKDSYDRLLLGIPIAGKLYRQIVLTRFVRGFRCLYEAGVSVTQNWRMTAELCDNAVLRKALLKGLPVIEQGGELRAAFEQTQVFSKKMLGMLAAGEKSGSLDTMLDVMTVHCERESEAAVGMMVKIAPIFIYLLIAGYIGFKLVSFYRDYFTQVLNY